jgi:predicted aspartyl protease
MGAIREEVEIIGVRKSKNIQALFDSGAYRNYIKRKLTDGEKVEDIGFHIFEGTHRAILANGDIVEGEKVRFKEIKIKDCFVKEPEFVIMDDLIEDVIVGVYLMQNLGIHLDPPSEKIEVMMIK